jgi:hypothetical protein
MRHSSLIGLVVAGLLAVAADAEALNSLGPGNNGQSVSGSFTGSCAGNVCTGTVTTTSGSYTGTFTVAAEPLAALLVGVGLVGAGYLRRR